MPPNTRNARHIEVLSRWPVLHEHWAQNVERARSRDTEAAPWTGAGPAGGITPLTAINRALGLPDDHGVDAVEQAQRTTGG